MKIKTITLKTKQATLEKDPTEGFYVVNRTKPRGHINFNARDEFGKQTTVQIPGVSMPIDLSTFIPAKNLILSTELRTLLSKSYIALVPDDAALKLFKENPALAKQRDVALGHMSNAKHIEKQSEEGEIQIELNQVDDKTVDPRQAFPFAYQVLTEEKTNPSMAEEMLSSRLDTLAQDEIEYLIQSLTNTGLKELCLACLDEDED